MSMLENLFGTHTVRKPSNRKLLTKKTPAKPKPLSQRLIDESKKRQQDSKRPFLQSTLKPKPSSEPGPGGPNLLGEIQRRAEQQRLARIRQAELNRRRQAEQVAEAQRQKTQRERLASERARKAELNRRKQAEQVAEAQRQKAQRERLAAERAAELRRREIAEMTPLPDSDPVDTVDRMNNPRPEDLDPVDTTVDTIDRINNPRPEDLDPIRETDPVDTTVTPAVDPVKVNEAIDQINNPVPEDYDPVDTVVTPDTTVTPADTTVAPTDTTVTPTDTTVAPTDTTTTPTDTTTTPADTTTEVPPASTVFDPILGVTPLDQAHANVLQTLADQIATAGVVDEATRARLLTRLQAEQTAAEARVEADRLRAQTDVDEAAATDLAQLAAELGVSEQAVADALATSTAGVTDSLDTDLSQLAAELGISEQAVRDALESATSGVQDSLETELARLFGLENIEELRLDQAHPNEIRELYNLLGRTGSITGGLATGARAGSRDRLLDEQAFDRADLARVFSGQRDTAEARAEDRLAALGRGSEDDLAQLRRVFGVQQSGLRSRADDRLAALGRTSDDDLAQLRRVFGLEESGLKSRVADQKAAIDRRAVDQDAIFKRLSDIDIDDLGTQYDDKGKARGLTQADEIARIGRDAALRIRKAAEVGKAGGQTNLFPWYIYDESRRQAEGLQTSTPSPDPRYEGLSETDRRRLTIQDFTNPNRFGG